MDSKENMKQFTSSLALGTINNIPIILLDAFVKESGQHIQVQDRISIPGTCRFKEEGSNMDIGTIQVPKASKE